MNQSSFGNELGNEDEDRGPADGVPADTVDAEEEPVIEEVTVTAGSVVDATASGAPDDEPIVLDGLRRTRLFGLDLVNEPSLAPVVEQILDGPRRDDDLLPLVLTPNVDIVVHLDSAPDSPEAELFERAQYCLPDGQPLVLFSKYLGERLQARLPGSGLFAELWPQVVERDIPAVVVASSDKVADMLADEHPKAGFVVPPYVDADDEQGIADVVTDILASARAVRPSLVFVGIGNPKDARIIANLLDRWDPQLGERPLCLGLGGSFSMYLGLTKRAPDWIQEIGMEWFYRFLQEPRRLFHRYFIRDAAFIGIVRREWRRSRAGR